MQRTWVTIDGNEAVANIAHALSGSGAKELPGRR